MRHWRRLPPPHASPWRAWLTWRGSLTSRITSRSRSFRVERLQQKPKFPNGDEYAQLGQPPHRLALVREVILHADGMPVVLAHSIACHRDLSGVWRSLRGLGNRPLAEALFANPLVARGPLEFARVDNRHPLWRRAASVFGPDLPPLWARRSRFRLAGRPLLVTEVFLPRILLLK
jgi:chorismate--pyruvate lyase